MTTRSKHTGRASSIPAGIALAACVSLFTTAALSAAIASALNRERITWEQAGYWIMGMLFLASFLGGKCAIAAVKRQKAMIAMMSGGLYWGMLLCITALLFGGNFGAVWVTFGMIAAGSGSAAMLSMPGKGRHGKRQGRRHG